jgi:hypothetical protein
LSPGSGVGVGALDGGHGGGGGGAAAHRSNPRAAAVDVGAEAWERLSDIMIE